MTENPQRTKSLLTAISNGDPPHVMTARHMSCFCAFDVCGIIYFMAVSSMVIGSNQNEVKSFSAIVEYFGCLSTSVPI